MKCLVLLALVALVAGKTVVEFSRRGFSCDETSDRPFDGTTKIVYAYGEEDPHWNKPDVDLNTAAALGQTFMHLQTDPFPDPPEDDTKTAEFRASHVTVPYIVPKQMPLGSLWMSMGFDAYAVIPECDEEHPVHVTKWEVVIEPGNIEFVHHMNFQSCKFGLEVDALEPANWGESWVGDNVAESLKDCWLNYAALMTWVIGATPQVFPLEAGLRFGGPFVNGIGLHFVNMEMHYDLPWYVPPEGETFDSWQPDHLMTDNSGVRVYYTSIMRPYDMGQVWIGVDYGETFFLPPGQTDFLSRGFSTPECLDPYEEGHVPEGRNGMWPQGNEVRFTNMNLHMHDQGRRFYARHVRNGVELPWIAAETHYNNYYQQYLSTPRVWKQGDIIVVDCYSNTEMYHQPFYGNLGTDEQMCLILANIYPTFNPIPAAQLVQDWRVDEPDYFYNRWCNHTQHFDPDFEKWEPPAKCPKGKDRRHPAFGDSDPAPLHTFDPKKFNVHIPLDTDEKVNLYWNYDIENDIADFALEVDTDGWVAFGVAGDNDVWTGKSDFHQVAGEDKRDGVAPGMPNSDVVVAWVDDFTGEPFFSDNYADDMSMTHVDTHQDCFRIKAKQDGVQYIRKK